jgi:hypothetical protein
MKTVHESYHLKRLLLLRREHFGSILTELTLRVSEAEPELADARDVKTLGSE